MKFTDGNWMMRPGVRASYASQAYEVDENDGGLTIQAPTRVIRHRGDTLEGPILSVRLSSPGPDVICVRVAHFSGSPERGPSHPVFAQGGAHVTTDAGDDAATLTAGALSVRVDRKNWGLEFVAGGRTVTRSGPRGLGLATVEGDGPCLHEQLSLGVGECVYGLGERFTALVKNGQVIENWNKDGGTGSEQAYKSVPFYLTNRGYGVFVNHPGAVSFEVASEKVSRVQFSVPGQALAESAEASLIYEGDG